jgi:hypothetical protein
VLVWKCRVAATSFSPFYFLIRSQEVFKPLDRVLRISLELVIIINKIETKS